jgi:2'-5' RNA ligase
VRTFLALELNPEIRAGLVRTLHRLRFTSAHMSWVPPENLHVTLLFLGDSPPERLAELMTRLRQIFPPPPAFACTVAELGTFGPPHSPRIVWAGVSDSSGCLLRLIETLQQTAVALGWPPEKRDPHPHITLGRIKPGPRDPDWIRRLEKDRAHIWGILPVSRLLLMQSHLKPEGARYERLDEIGLKN